MTDLALHTAASLLRLLAGVALSLVVGTAIGIAIGYFRIPRRIFSPVVYALAPVPKVALLPLVMLAFGLGDAAKIFLIFIIMVFQVILEVSGAVGRIPPQHLAPSRAAGAQTWALLRLIVLPACVPELFVALRVGLATGISALFFAETFGTKRGLGFYIMDMWMRLNYTNMALGIIAMAVLGWGLTALVNLAERRICKWRY